MTTELPVPQPKPPAAGLFGTGSTSDRVATPRPVASASQREAFAQLFRHEGGSPRLA